MSKKQVSTIERFPKELFPYITKKSKIKLALPQEKLYWIAFFIVPKDENPNIPKLYEIDIDTISKLLGVNSHETTNIEVRDKLVKLSDSINFSFEKHDGKIYIPLALFQSIFAKKRNQSSRKIFFRLNYDFLTKILELNDHRLKPVG